jgi:hypothetical protein
MTEFNLAPDEQMEIIGPDYALAYCALARRVSAIDALMQSGAVSSSITHKIREEIEEAMLVIMRVETTVLIASSIKKAS